MPAVVRYIWMFRTAAVLFVLFGLSGLYTYGLTNYRPQNRPVGLALGAIALVVGIFLFRRAKFAIALSALGAGIVCLSAAAFAPQAHGPGILILAGLALLTGVYVVLSLRVLLGQGAASTNHS